MVLVIPFPLPKNPAMSFTTVYPYSASDKTSLASPNKPPTLERSPVILLNPLSL